MKLRSLLLQIFIALIVCTACSPTFAVTPTDKELSVCKKWTTEHLLSKNARFPFTFTYGDKSSSELLPKWKFTSSKREIEEHKTETTLIWEDPESRVSVRCVVVAYHDYPAVEWTLYFKNEGHTSTPILKDIQALDSNFERENGGEFVLHGTKGDWCAPDSYAPFSETLAPGSTKSFAPYGGRPTNAAFPFYDVQTSQGGVFLAIGWPGEWASSFTRDEGRGLHITAGQQLFSATLRPGEEIRSPLIALVFWRGTDLFRAQNIWRRWMIDYNLPRTADGKLPPTQIVACSSHQFKEMTRANEANQKLFVERYLEEGMKIDYWWMDAGWYPCGGDWVNTGTWVPDPERFPNGLRAVSDYAHAKGVKIIVWFEPERVGDSHSWIATNHPDWVLRKKAETPPPPQGGAFGSGPGGLLNLGNAEARNWLINHVDHLLTEQGIDLYRQDFNMDPLPFWRGADTPDRQGITENLYVQGYLAYWDALRERHPQLRIDSCASGGRRDDLETLRRATPLIRSDYLFEPTSQQNHHYMFTQWIPYHGAGYVVGSSALGFKMSSGVAPYDFRANMSPSLTLCYDMRQTNLNYRLAEKLFKQLKAIQPNYFGDFYPLTPYSLSNNVWLAWQYDRPEAGAGVVQVFRRPDSNQERETLQLQGLNPKARYEVENLDGGKEIQTGKELMHGFTVELKNKPQAAVITYKRLK